jgi:predicted SprT family Zn-dependent metalloprotease
MPVALIPMEFSNRLNSTGGYFRYDRFGPIKIVINKRMMEANGKEFVDQVVPHEVAHWFTHLVHGSNHQAHGREWKAMMRLLGQEPKRTHSFKRAEPKKGFTYVVNGNEIQVGPIRHKKIQNGTGSYRVRGGGAIKASDWEGYKAERTTELPNGFVSIRPPVTKKKSVRKGKTKANTVRALINDYKAAGFTSERARKNKTVVEEVMAVANLSETMAKRYLKNLWS